MKKYILLVFFVVMLLFLSSVSYASGNDVSVPDGVFARIFDFIKDIFIPSPNYFHNQIERLQAKVKEKIGGIGYLYNMLNNFFADMKKTSSSPLMFSIPDNYFFGGYKGFSLDFLTSARPYLNFLRDFLNVVICLLTALVCYKQLTALFQL